MALDHSPLKLRQRRGRDRERLPLVLEDGLHVVRERVQEIVPLPRRLVVRHRRHPPVEAPGQGVPRGGGGSVATARQVGEEGVALVRGGLFPLLAERRFVPSLGGGNPGLQLAHLLNETLPPGHALELLEDDPGQPGALFAGLVQRIRDRRQPGLRQIHHFALHRNPPFDLAEPLFLLVVDHANARLHPGERFRHRFLVHARQVKLGQPPDHPGPAFAGPRQLALQFLDSLLRPRHLAPGVANAPDQAAMYVFP